MDSFYPAKLMDPVLGLNLQKRLIIIYFEMAIPLNTEGRCVPLKFGRWMEQTRHCWWMTARMLLI